jgi:hypothetical protein
VNLAVVRALRALGWLSLCGCSLVLGASCTTSETDSIDLTAAQKKPPKDPMKPPPDMMPKPCMNDDDAGCPKDPMKPPPDMMPCMNDEDAGCPKEPMTQPKPPPP